MNIKAAMDLISERARGNGWAEWPELCEAAEIEPCPLRFLSEDGETLYGELARRVSIWAPMGGNEPTRFRAR